MTVFRVKHNANYVCINKLALEDPHLSLKAKGLWAYCMSRPDDWTFRICHLESVMMEGRDAIRNAMNELITRGYCLRVCIKNSHGRFESAEYRIYEVPQIEERPIEIKENSPKTPFPSPANTTLLSNDNTKYIPPLPNVVSQAQQHSPGGPKGSVAVLKKDLKEDEEQDRQDLTKESLRKAFKRSLKKEEVNRAVKYYLNHPQEVFKASNPIGFVVYAIRNNLDLEDQEQKEIMEKRKKWANEHEYTTQGGGAAAAKEAYCIYSGSGNRVYRYDSHDSFWKEKGLEFPIGK